MKIRLTNMHKLNDLCKAQRGECTVCGLKLSDPVVRKYCGNCRKIEKVHAECSVREWLT